MSVKGRDITSYGHPSYGRVLESYHRVVTSYSWDITSYCHPIPSYGWVLDSYNRAVTSYSRPVVAGFCSRQLQQSGNQLWQGSTRLRQMLQVG